MPGSVFSSIQKLIIRSIKDMTHYTPLFAKPGDLMMDFSNIVDTSLYVTGIRLRLSTNEEYLGFWTLRLMVNKPGHTIYSS